MLFNFFSLWKVLKTMFVDFKRSTLKIPVSDYLKPMENSVFQFSISDSHSVKLGLTQHVFMLIFNPM